MRRKQPKGRANWPQKDRELGLINEKVGNKWMTKYSPELGLAIVERVAQGDLLKDICAEPDMPVRNTFLSWVARVPELRSAFQAARELSAYAFEEEAVGLARERVGEPGTTQRLRAAEIALGQLRWSASRRDPAKYGDKGQTNIVVPIQINTSLDMGEQGGAIGVEIPDIYTLDVTPELPQIAPEDQPIIKKPRMGPTKRQLTPLIPMDAQTDRSRVEAKRAREVLSRKRFAERMATIIEEPSDGE